MHAFLTMANPPKLNNLFNEIKENLDADSHYHLHPHLSLLYQQLPMREKQNIADSLTLTCQSISFDPLKLMALPSLAANAAAVNHWQCLKHYRLSA